MPPINKKIIFLFLLLLLFLIGFFIGRIFIQKELTQSLQEERNKVLALEEKLQTETHSNIEAKCALDEFYSEAELLKGNKDSAELMMKLLYEGGCPPSSIELKVIDVKRKRTWEKTLDIINAQLVSCHDWFDTVQVLSVWLYQNTRVGDINKYTIDRVIGRTYVLSRLNMKYLYQVNNSDSVTSNCGFHAYYALIFYDFYGIKSYCYTMRPNPIRKKSAEGHMMNVLQNPHDRKWYPVDNFLGIRYKYKGEWLDMETYFQLARQQALGEVSIDTFGIFKFHIQNTPCVQYYAWNIDTAEIISAELSNFRDHFRIVAPFTLKHRFSQFKELFDPIAATYDQPPHVNWIDLAQRMPMYGARMFPLVDSKAQASADSLLSSWKK